MAFTHTTIDGLDTYVDTVPGMKNFDIELVVRVGSVDEPDDLAGICHALEHCTHLHTPSFDGQPAIDAFADAHSFDRNASTYYTRTNYFAKGLEPDPMFRLIGELVTGAVFEPARVTEEMKSVRREARTNLDDIDSLSHCFRDYVLFGRPYGREVIGYHDRLHFTAEQLGAFYERYYTVPNMTLIVVGDITPDDVAGLVRTHITAHARTHPADISALPAPARPLPGTSAFGYVRGDSANARLCLQAAVPMTYIDRDDADEWAYAAARSLVSKAVIDDVRYKRGLSYDGFFGLRSYNHRNAARLYAEVTVDNADVDTTFDALRAVLARPARSYNDDEVAQALKRQLMSASEDVDDILGRADLYVNALSLGSPVRGVEDAYQTARETTVADVRRALEDTLAIWHAAELIECVTGQKETVGSRHIISQDIFA